MQPTPAFPRLVTFLVSLAGTAIALCMMVEVCPPGSTGYKFLVIGAGLCTWFAGLGHSMQGQRQNLQSPDDEDTDPRKPSMPSARALLPLLFLASMMSASGCANQYTVARKALTVADHSQILASQEWEKHDKVEERKVIDRAFDENVSKDELRMRVGAWRKVSDTVDHALRALSGASHAAKLAIDAAQAGKLTVVAVLPPVFAAARALVEALLAGGVKPPPELVALVGGVR
jgi:hypothetical protein